MEISTVFNNEEDDLNIAIVERDSSTTYVDHIRGQVGQNIRPIRSDFCSFKSDMYERVSTWCSICFWAGLSVL